MCRRSRRLPFAAAKIIATDVMPRMVVRPRTSGALSSTTPSVETELASVRIGRGATSVFDGRVTVAGAVAPYADDVAISVSCFATTGSTVRNAVFVAGDSVDTVVFPMPAAWLPPLVGIISTYWETADAGPSPAAAGYGTPRMPPMQTRHPMPA